MNSPRLSFAFEYAAHLHAADLRKGTTIPYLSHIRESLHTEQIGLGR